MWKGCPIPQMKTPEFPPSPASSFWSRMMYWNTSFILAKQLKSLLLWSDATDCKGASQFCPDRVRGAPAFPGAQGKKKKKKVYFNQEEYKRSSMNWGWLWKEICLADILKCYLNIPSFVCRVCIWNMWVWHPGHWKQRDLKNAGKTQILV